MPRIKLYVLKVLKMFLLIFILQNLLYFNFEFINNQLIIRLYLKNLKKIKNTSIFGEV